MYLKESMFVNINTLQAERLGDFQKNLGSCSCETGGKRSIDVSEIATIPPELRQKEDNLVVQLYVKYLR